MNQVTQINKDITDAFMSNFYKVCPVCKEKYRDLQEIKFIKKIGMCINCDHIKTS